MRGGISGTSGKDVGGNWRIWAQQNSPTVSRTRKLFNLLSHFLGQNKSNLSPIWFQNHAFREIRLNNGLFGVQKFKFVIELSSFILYTLSTINTLALYKISLRKHFHKIKYVQFIMHYNCILRKIETKTKTIHIIYFFNLIQQ